MGNGNSNNKKGKGKAQQGNSQANPSRLPPAEEVKLSESYGSEYSNDVVSNQGQKMQGLGQGLQNML